jgi:hypothetical protein
MVKITLGSPMWTVANMLSPVQRQWFALGSGMSSKNEAVQGKQNPTRDGPRHGGFARPEVVQRGASSQVTPSG